MSAGGGGRTKILHRKRVVETDNPFPVSVTGVPNVNVQGLPEIPEGTKRIGGTYDVGGLIIDDNAIPREVKRNFVDLTSTGVTEVVKAQGEGNKIHILGLILWPSTSDCDDRIKFLSNTTQISGTMSIVNRDGKFGGIILPYNAHGWFETEANEAFNIDLLAGAGPMGINVIWTIDQ